ncbi:glycosyltransferase [Candidatus Uhrbacteria bacterium]|jgi:glycosyltransferase involved in cell wall biosynthesis|nr:glycosyltransferase [Candidatus Uhrbacteria bacterium]
MKILVISNLYPPESRGGAEMIARDTAEEAVRQGHEVTVLSTGTHDADDVVGGVRVVRFTPKLPYHILNDADQSLGSRLQWHARDLVGSRATRTIVTDAIKDTAPDLILTFNLRGMEIGSVAKAVRRSRISWIHELHDVQLLVPSGLEWFGPQKRVGLRWLWQSKIVKMFYGGLTGYIMGSPDTVVSPSVFMIDAHKKSGLFDKSESRVLINPVDMSDVSENVKRDSEEVRLLCVAQLELHKGVNYVIEALNHVGEHEVTLDIVSAGSQLDELMNQALDLPESVNVSFHGRVPHEKVFELMKQASALILPSVVIENCPGVILEARASDLPVIASNVGGVSEFIDLNGLFEPANARAIVEKIHLVAEGKVNSKGRSGLISVSEYVKELLK